MVHTLLRSIQSWLPRRIRPTPTISDSLWHQTVHTLPFLAEQPPAAQARLRILCGHFLQEKEFHGAHGLKITDAMALNIAAQACLPLLHVSLPSGDRAHDPLQVLDWYSDFVGIVVQPGAAVARREITDGVGVVHRYSEVLAGEAMDRGPVMLSWQDVARAADLAKEGKNVVIHEFAHKFDMRGMQHGNSPDGAPPLPVGFLGKPNAAAAREHWRRTMQGAYAQFREAVAMAERFGGEAPWLDDYAATNPAEFFAVTCEAYFVHRERFALEFPELLPLYDGFFRSAT
jgi:Mlc titration factor MtfA (ptsG expression regulator)